MHKTNASEYRKMLATLFIATTLAFSQTACALNEDTGDADDERIALLGLAAYAANVLTFELNGTWTTNFGAVNSYTNTASQSVSSFGTTTETIVAFDNASNVYYSLTSPSASFNPNTYSKNVYVGPFTSGSVTESAFCTVAFGFSSLAEAQADTTTANTATPGESGSCGSFTFTFMVKQ